jgi:hypothetical protein
MLCCEWSLVKDEGSRVLLRPLTCRRWSCDYCHPIRKRELTGQAIAGRPNTFITLTVNPREGEEPNARARALAHAWRRCVRAAKRKYHYPSIPFLAVFETTKAGEPHLHILARVPWIDQKWLSAFMAREIGAPIVDIRRIRRKRTVARYIAKYVGKEPHRFEGTKRYWSTRDYQLSPPPEPQQGWGAVSKWTIVRQDFCYLADHYSWHGREIVISGVGAVTPRGAPP